MLAVGELPKRRRVLMRVEDPEQTVEETLKLLGKQNVGLAPEEWLVVKGGESRDAKCAHFDTLIPERSLEAIKNYNFKPYCGMERASIKLLDKDRNAETRATSEGEGGSE